MHSGCGRLAGNRFDCGPVGVTFATVLGHDAHGPLANLTDDLADFILGKSRSLRLLKSSSLPEARAPETRVFDMTGNSPIKNVKM